MISRVSTNLRASGQLLRCTQMVTFEPTGPRSLPTASSMGIDTVETSPMRVMTSYERRPARVAGVLSSGFITVSLPSRTEITMPRPPNSPLVEVFMSAKASGLSNTECGSSVERAPFTAAYSTARMSFCGGRCFSKKRKTSRSLRLISHRLSTSSTVMIFCWPGTLIFTLPGPASSTQTSATWRSTSSRAATSMALGSMREGST